MAVLALVGIVIAMEMSGCGGIHMAVVISSPTKEVATTDSSRTVAVRPTPNLRPKQQPKIRTPEATPTPLPEIRVPAQSAPERIVAPSIGLDAAVVLVGWSAQEQNGTWFSQWETASGAAGFHEGSALPGHVGNTVVSGHHNIEGKVFARLVELAPGDSVTLYADGRQYRYQVIDKFVLREADAPVAQRRQNALWIAQTRDERLTLTTCWPPDSNTHRVIVIAKPISGELARSSGND
jgi:sortase A